MVGKKKKKIYRLLKIVRKFVKTSPRKILNDIDKN